MKYNQPGGMVTIECNPTATDRMKIAVRDTGPGIAESDLQKLFQPFERLSAPGAIEGTGLGLALSRRLVEAMGGSLTVCSTVGEGTTFTVIMPLVEQPVYKRSLVVDAEPAGTVDAAPATLLLIEDNLANLQLIEFILAERPSVKLLPAMQGKLGLELARKHLPDMILLDLHLPDIDGSEVLRRLQLYPETRDIPVVILSADATPGQVDRLREAGAYSYITKPIDVDAFLRSLDAVLLPRTAGRGELAIL